MKKMFFAVVLAVLIPFQALSQVTLWQEGKHYNIIADEATATPVVTEYFSFWCPACFSFEPLVAQMKIQLPDDVEFDKVHVNFMRFAGAETQDAATKAMMIARSLDRGDELTGAIFNYIHRDRQVVANLDDLRSVFIANGVDPEAFDKQAKSFSTNSAVARNNNKVTKFREHITGVPSFIVNGKYQATFSRDMSADDMINLIVWLSQQS
ncbi:thiol:disulfide interchange protein DsbA/DsbL [Glaciecola sp. XM2]|jgi:thiol:disulfide interchange protein DsbA|uniref:thiol:disulfide interchange protein DsbA/DsbL n=1 Tax=Glaciecola sp. XM2 TaxID=1914931 RepID=UPI001BDF65CF|nr:thiol:disulfide interchange protein DsbA/DsbL [Glaciecola sp. XM2]MBT1450352.1 thiol:disulfide interchange protein DsbA/DsbL [Glaciecola sp. XM2]